MKIFQILFNLCIVAAAPSQFRRQWKINRYLSRMSNIFVKFQKNSPNFPKFFIKVPCFLIRLLGIFKILQISPLLMTFLKFPKMFPKFLKIFHFFFFVFQKFIKKFQPTPHGSKRTAKWFLAKVRVEWSKVRVDIRPNSCATNMNKLQINLLCTSNLIG